MYEEETSHIRDSIYVYYYWNDTTSYDFYVGAESALTGYRFRKWPTYLQGVQGCSPTNPVNKKCILITGDKGKFQDFVSENYVFFMKYSVGDSLGSYNNQYPNNFFKIADIKSSYQLGSYTFGETVKVFDPHARQENDNPTNYYYSKGVGLVRKELLDSNEVWNLVNYYIIP